MAAPPTQIQPFQDLLEACRAKQEAGVLTLQQVRNVEGARDQLVAAVLLDEATIADVTVQEMVDSGVPLGVAAALKKAFPGAAAPPPAVRSTVHHTIEQRLPFTTKYAAFANNNGVKEAAVVVDPNHVATYHHNEHASWDVGRDVEVFVHSESAAQPCRCMAKVDYVNKASDFILLKVPGPLQAPVLDSQLNPGQQYFVLGQSAQAQGDASSVSHGMIAATKLDQLAHVRGDIMSGKGDSGAGCFAVETGCLIGMVVGVDHIAHRAILVPGAVIAGALADVNNALAA